MKINGKIAAFVMFAAVFGASFMISKPAYADCPPCSAPDQPDCVMADGTIQNPSENSPCYASSAPASSAPASSAPASSAPASSAPASSAPASSAPASSAPTSPAPSSSSGGGTSSCPAGMSARECAKRGLGEVTNPGDETDLPHVITTVLSAIFFVLGIVAVIIIILGGFWYMTSQGDSAKVKKGKETILYGVIGLIICLIATAIVNFVISSLEN